MKQSLSLFITVLALQFLAVESNAESYQISPETLTEHVKILASDSLEGREIGESGEKKAAEYIASIFTEISLEPKGDEGSFLQAFEFTKEIRITDKSRLSLNQTELVLHEDFRPMRQSASGTFDFDQVIPVGYGITIEEGSYDDYADLDVAGQAVLIKRFSPSSDDHPHVDFRPFESLADKIRNAIAHDVAGIFFITPADHDDTISVRGFAHITAKEIPIFWLKRSGLAKISQDVEAPEPFAAEMLTDLARIRDTGYNVVGFLQGQNDTAILIGAHFDHLGYGTSASLYKGDEKKIHYGADDNASGVATMLELARQFSGTKSELNYSMLFVSFSGEERGLLGSSHFAKEALDDPRLVRLMINLDMIGRLSEQENGLAILGTGTCTEFKIFFDSLPDPGIKLAFKESGIGPSDHTAFYNQEIPVLFFFTGAHKDYHRPGDTWEKLDYAGLTKVASIISEVSDYFDDYPAALTFQKVKDDSKGSRRSSFSVSLGVMPDYVAEVKGLKIDGVTPDKPAERAGLQAGDIVFKMGEYAVDDIYGYMNALGKFKKGQEIEVLLLRATDTVSVQVIFD